MKPNLESRTKQHIKIYIWIMIIGLALSGLTAFALETELQWLNEHNSVYPDVLSSWLQTIYGAIKTTNQHFPYLSYGTDWLAFAHLMLAILFIGPLKNPVKNIWVIEFGIIACILIIPLAFIAGNIREIPIFWRLIDCSFGVIGVMPLAICYRDINLLKTIKPTSL